MEDEALVPVEPGADLGMLVGGTSASIAFRKRTRYAFFCGVPDCLLCCLLLNKTENPKWLREENTICPDWIFKDSWTYAVKLIRR